jgi:phenylpropionate dioxygenase-like ring-hydroxylating dioxygenase large terminal subunit
MTTPFPAVPPGWYILCRSQALRAQPKRLLFAGRALVAFRDATGRVGVLEDRCAHRAVPLSSGKVCGDSLQCPYHGWAYDRQGKLSSLPALQHCPQLKREMDQVTVPAWLAQEQQGFIWIRSDQAPQHDSHGSHGTGDNTNPSSAPPTFAHYQEPGWTSFVMQTRFTATVEACLENFLDCPHATFVHRYWFRAPTQKHVKAIVRTLPDGAEAEFFEEPREKSVVWAMLAPKTGKMVHTDRFIAPNTSRVDYAFPGGLHYVITSSCTPINERETMVYTAMTFRYGRIGLSGFFVRLFFEPLSRWIIRQDVKMLALQQHNLDALKAQADSGEPKLFHSTPADLLGSHIIQWRKAMLRGEAPPPAGQESHVDITL